MSKIVRIVQVTTWKRVLNAARRTRGKAPLDKEPSKKWKAKMLLSEHSPIRLLEYDFSWEDIKQWVTVHLVRHHEGCEKFVHSQRPEFDRCCGYVNTPKYREDLSRYRSIDYKED